MNNISFLAGGLFGGIITVYSIPCVFSAVPAPLPEFKDKQELSDWRKAQSRQGEIPPQVSNISWFYTGKICDVNLGYVFLMRNYSPDTCRWMVGDLAGFPDGSNNYQYVKSPTFQFDYLGAFSLSGTTASPSSTANEAGTHFAAAFPLIHVGAGSSFASAAAGQINAYYGYTPTIANSDLSGSVSVSDFFILNQTQSGSSVGASVSLTLTFNSPPTGFAWIQIQRLKLSGSNNFSPWALDVSQAPGPSYSPGPIMHDVADVGNFNSLGAKRELYAFAAINSGSNNWTLYDGVFLGGRNLRIK